nr:hypothetical protein [Tanacetum cinerariifolium]
MTGGLSRGTLEDNIGATPVGAKDDERDNDEAGRLRKAKEAFTIMELPKREASRISGRPVVLISKREDRFHKGGYGSDRRRNEGRNMFNNRDGLATKRKSAERDESWMKALIVFPPLLMEGASDEPHRSGHRRVLGSYSIRGPWSVVEVMFEHCFENLSPAIKLRLRETQMDLVGFARGVVKPLGKIKLEVVFEDGGLFSFLDNTLHGKIPHPKGVATLVTRSAIISECHRLERKQVVKKEVNKKVNQEKEVPTGVDLTKQTLVNLAYPDQLITIEGSQAEQCKNQDVAKWKHGCFRMGICQYDEDTKESHRILPKCKPLDGTCSAKKKSYGFRQNPSGSKKGSFWVIWSPPRKSGLTQRKPRQSPICSPPWTLKQMQSLSGNLAALKRFLSRSTKKSLPFFKTLKDITKENKDEYRWTESAEEAFQEMKKVIVELSLLTTLDVKRGREELRPVGKLGPVIVTHVQETTKASGKLAKYSVELGAYNIIYEPKRTMKGHILADFLPKAPVGTPTEEFFRLSTKPPSQDDMERWTLFTDDASNSKGFGAGLVLISPSGIEFTYALRLSFASKNNEAEYQALLAGLRMTKKMKVRSIDVKVDSKLVASQINGSYMASSTSMIKYLTTIKECIVEFETFAIQNISRNFNQKADILSKLVTIAFDHLTKKVLVEVLAKRSTDQKEVGEIMEEEEDN